MKRSISAAALMLCVASAVWMVGPAGAVDVLPQLPPNPAYDTVLEPFDLVMPSGNTVYGLVRRPDPAQYPGVRFAAVVMVPGGLGPGRMQMLGRDAWLTAGAGMVVVGFNAEGRVDARAGANDILSEGTEDYNGFRHQDGLARIIEWVAQRPYVVPDNIGVWTQSYGITMGAGCLGRYPALPVKYLVDGEGPETSFVTCQGPRFLAGDMRKYNAAKHLFPLPAPWQDNRQEVQDFWAEREAIRFIGGFQGRYLRLQATWDHAQPPDDPAQVPLYDLPASWPADAPTWYRNKHTDDIVARAIDEGVPWVRVNLAEQGNTPNTVYDHDNPPVYLPGRLGDQPWGVRAVVEMARMP